MTRNQIDYWRLVEEQRANLAKERETNRSNLAAERENYRSHTAQEGLEKSKQQETNRHNTVSELLSRTGLQIDSRNATTNRMQATAKQEANDIARDANRIREGELAVRQQEADTHRYSAMANTGTVGKGYALSSMMGQDLKKTANAVNPYVAPKVSDLMEFLTKPSASQRIMKKVYDANTSGDYFVEKSKD